MHLRALTKTSLTATTCAAIPRDPGAVGIYVFNRAQAEVTNNQITNNGIGILTDQTGRVTRCTGNTFSGNQLNTQGNVRCS
jgi:nitrous oxidase accessory protein NosD